MFDPGVAINLESVGSDLGFVKLSALTKRLPFLNSELESVYLSQTLLAVLECVTSDILEMVESAEEELELDME